MWTWIRRNPVKALTVLYTLFVTLDGALAGGHLVPNVVLAWIAVIEMVLGVVLGIVTHGRVTPLIDPKAADGTPLVKDARTL